jgi:glycerate 2-kinase
VKVLIAPDKFSGTLTAAEAAEAMAAGWARERPRDTLVIRPMADGGDGTIDVVEAFVDGCERIVLEVADARGRAVEAAWLRLPDGRALVEAAQACGLWRLDEADRDPRLATSYGVGQLVVDALARDAREVVVGLGGTATVDGGAGMALALGHRLLRADGNGVKVGGQFLLDIVRVQPAAPPAAPVVAAVDVTNPLLGPDGAAPVYGPQKGADDKDIVLLEAALRRFADTVEATLPGGPWRDEPGAGAAGGLGFALAAFCRARFEMGAAVVAGLVGFDAAVRDADVVLTGEGKLDAQSAQGKVPVFVAGAGRDAGARVAAIAGQIEAGGDQGYDAARDLGPEGLQRAYELVAERAAELAAGLRASEEGGR